jgi:hypothetical protein
LNVAAAQLTMEQEIENAKPIPVGHTLAILFQFFHSLDL